jgi:deoxyribonucleoside regulator
MPEHAQNLVENELAISVVKKYYEMGMTQDQIAREEFISKSTVSRILKKAIESGMVKFQLNYPMDSITMIEQAFSRYFNFRNIHIAPSFTDNHDTRTNDTCRLAATYICEIIKPNDILGIGWGLSMEKLTNILISEVVEKPVCEKVVMLDGSIASAVSSAKSNEIIEKLADFFSANGYLLPAPLVVDNKKSAERIKSDSHIKDVIAYGREARIALFSIGYASNDSVLIKRGAYGREDYDEVLLLGAVGDILGHCYNINGRPVSSRIDDCLIGLDLKELKQKEYRIGIAVGNQKAKAIVGALRGGIISELFTDAETAREVIHIAEQMNKKQMLNVFDPR